MHKKFKVNTLLGRDPTHRPRHRHEDNIKMYLGCTMTQAGSQVTSFSTWRHGSVCVGYVADKVIFGQVFV
jgi:hypothetical protein